MLSAGGLGEKTTTIKNDGGKITHYPTSQIKSIPLKNKKNIELSEPSCCGIEFEENGQSFPCGQLWKGNERKYCSNCRNKKESIDFSELDKEFENG